MDIKKYIFWEYYTDEKDNFIYNILDFYFRSIREIFSEEWGRPESIITKTTGYSAFMRFLRYLSMKTEGEEKKLNKQYFTECFTKAKINIKPLISKNYPPGLLGEKMLYEDLKKMDE